MRWLKIMSVIEKVINFDQSINFYCFSQRLCVSAVINSYPKLKQNNKMANTYQVFVDDNFHHMDEEERYKHGDFQTFEEALTACRSIVDEYLQSNYKEGITADELYQNYTMFGEDPFILGENIPFHFSAWDYAKEKCSEICEMK